MSLRRRLAMVIGLGLATLLVALATITHLVQSSDRAREHAAAAAAEAGAQALADDLQVRGDGAVLGAPLSLEAHDALQAIVRAVLRPVPNAAGGYCTGAGHILVAVAKPAEAVKRHDPAAGRVFPLAATVEDAVEALCAGVHAGGSTEERVRHPNMVDRVAVARAGDHAAAWFVVRAPARDGSRWPIEIMLLGTLAVTLAAVAFGAMRGLERGVAALKGGLGHLEVDLRAKLPVPQARELGEIAAGLEQMASRLADARDRERALEQRLAVEDRLAALGRVAAGVAHEVRNPLGAMKLRLDMLKRRAALDDLGREDVGVCIDEIARLNQLVTSLLGASSSELAPVAAIDLGALADERIARAASDAEEAEVTLVREGEAEGLGDRGVLAGALDNLLRNAIEASPPGGQVRVCVRAGAEGEGSAIEVEDAGDGVPSARQHELFEPFFTTKGAAGTGLGLWLSRALLKARRAELSYARVEGRTRLRISLPARGGAA